MFEFFRIKNWDRGERHQLFPRLFQFFSSIYWVFAKGVVPPSRPTMSMEIEETLRRISSHRGVKGVIICNSEGAPIRSNLPEDEEATYSALISQLASKANSVVRTLDEADELTFFRLRSKKHEIMIAPDKEYLLIVVQDPNF